MQNGRAKRAVAADSATVGTGLSQPRLGYLVPKLVFYPLPSVHSLALPLDLRYVLFYQLSYHVFVVATRATGILTQFWNPLSPKHGGVT
jgi:hypothetical protein